MAKGKQSAAVTIAKLRSQLGKKGKKHCTKKNAFLGGRFILRSAKDGIALSAARKLPDFAGTYQGPVDKLLAGGALKMLGQGGSALIEIGIAEGIANLIDTQVMPMLGGLVGGASPAKNGNGGSSVVNLAAYR